MPQAMSDTVVISKPNGQRRRCDARVTRSGATVTAVRFRTGTQPGVGDTIDCRPGSLTVATLASSGQDLTDGVTVAT